MKKRALIISCFNWYQPRLASVRQFLLKKYNVTVLIADFDHISKQKINTKYSECTYIKVPEYQKNISIARIRSHLVFGKTVSFYLKKLRPELIFLQIPPNNSAKYCLNYKKNNPEIKYYIDLIDLWPESMPIRGLEKSVIFGYWKKMRNDSLKAADYVFTECGLYQEILKGVLRSEKSSVLYLFKKETEEEKKLVQKLLVENRKRNVEGLSFAYLGSINNIIDMEGIRKILKEVRAKGIETCIHIIGKGEKKEKFLQILENTGAKVYYYGAIYEQLEKIKLLAGCDYAFNMMKESVSVGLTIKSVDYFSMGLPIINNIKGDTWEIVEKYNVGINYDSFMEEIRKITKENVRIQKNNAIALYEKLFTEERFMTQIEKVINRI